MFCSTALTARIERAEAGQNSPFNKVVGLGFGGAPDDGVLDEIERIAPRRIRDTARRIRGTRYGRRGRGIQTALLAVWIKSAPAPTA